MSEKHEEEMEVALNEARYLVSQLHYYPEVVLLVQSLDTHDFEECISFFDSLEAQIATEHSVSVREAYSNGLDEGWVSFIITQPEVQK